MRKRTIRRRGFTIVEAIVSLSMTACAGSALLLGISTSLKTTNDLLDDTIAIGMAQRMVDEIAGKRYHGTLSGEGPYQVTLGPANSEKSGSSRILFDDIDDFNGYSAKPPKDPYGVTLGTDNGQGSTRHKDFQAVSGYFDAWRQVVDVYYVSATNLTQRLAAGQTSDFRAVEVSIYYDESATRSRLVAKQRRVFAYVPIP